MTSLGVVVLILALSYVVGAIPFGYLVARWRGVNIFEHGSGNIGATNVGRILGHKYGALVFVLDFAKGAVPVALASFLSEPDGIDLPPHGLPVLAGLSAFLGHVFPVWLRFRGGKGVATGAGIVAVLLPVPMLAALLVWAAVAASFRMVGLASLTAAAFLCLFQLGRPDPLGREHVVPTSFCLLVTALVFVRHRANIQRLFLGKENQMSDNSTLAYVSRLIHVFALGLWFGTGIFFNFVVGIGLFDTFWKIGEQPGFARPIWFPINRPYTRDPESWKKITAKVPFQDEREVRREQGTRAAGAAVGPLLRIYFPLQGGCGLLALVTALGWSKREPESRIHRFRVWLLFVAVVIALLSWPLEQKVADLGAERDFKIEKLLIADVPTEELVEEATDAKAAFNTWHLCSLGLSLFGVVLVTAAMALVVQLPDLPPQRTAMAKAVA